MLCCAEKALGNSYYSPASWRPSRAARHGAAPRAPRARRCGGKPPARQPGLLGAGKGRAGEGTGLLSLGDSVASGKNSVCGDRGGEAARTTTAGHLVVGVVVLLLLLLLLLFLLLLVAAAAVAAVAVSVLLRNKRQRKRGGEMLEALY